MGGRDNSGTLGRRGYRAKPHEGRRADAPDWRPRFNRRAMRIRTRLQRLEQRAWTVRVKPPKERPASRSFAHRREARTRPGMLTRVARPFGAPRPGSLARTSSNRMPEQWEEDQPPTRSNIVLRCCGPKRARSGVTRECAACGSDRGCISRRLCKQETRSFAFALSRT